MKFLKKLVRRIISQPIQVIHKEIKKLDKIESDLRGPKGNISKFKSFGKNSYFWGSNHYVTGYENFEIGENVHINDNSFIVADGGLRIGDNTHISRNLVLYTRNHDYEGSLLPYDENMVYKPVTIGKNVWIGMNVCIAPGTEIGDGCIIGLGAVISGIIPHLAIVGSPKAVILKSRDFDLYHNLNSQNLFGGINGQFYNWSGAKVLKQVGDIFYASRSISEVIKFDGKLAIKKSFYNTKSAQIAFVNELKAYEVFSKYNWCPKLLKKEDNYIIVEFFDSETRVDQESVIKDSELLGEIIWCLLDIFNEGYSHRDFHSKNIFSTNRGIKICDFETIIEHDFKSNFLDSYDITGNGLESPFKTGMMHFFSESNYSLGKKFKVPEKSELLKIMDGYIKKKLLNSSITFSSRRNTNQRVLLQKLNIYSTFDLKYTKILASEGQRNTNVRFNQFRISKEKIENKSLLDLGSNIGGTLLNLAKYKPSKMVGIEYDVDKVELANKLATFNDISNVSFFVNDIESKGFNYQHFGIFDVVFCLAVIEHLRDKSKLFELLSSFCKETLYFEGNSGTKIEYVESGLKEVGFKFIEFIGYSNDEKKQSNNVRPMWIAKK
jgi:acetyltransferase-like isoleucine patch superfamily enzyme/predicted RNA methylase